jgi:Ca2+-binding RTX toxin-like protein
MADVTDVEEVVVVADYENFEWEGFDEFYDFDGDEFEEAWETDLKDDIVEEERLVLNSDIQQLIADKGLKLADVLPKGLYIAQFNVPVGPLETPFQHRQWLYNDGENVWMITASPGVDGTKLQVEVANFESSHLHGFNENMPEMDLFAVQSGLNSTFNPAEFWAGAVELAEAMDDAEMNYNFLSQNSNSVWATIAAGILDENQVEEISGIAPGAGDTLWEEMQGLDQEDVLSLYGGQFFSGSLVLGEASTANDVDGTNGDDSFIAGSEDDVYEGGEGNDKFLLSEGEDWVDGDEGNDVVYAGADDDTAYGGRGSDLLYGDAGDDHLEAGAMEASYDFLFGGAGADVLIGSSGDNYLEGGAGADLMTGGKGTDVFLFRDFSELSASSPDVITDLNVAEGDKIYIFGLDANVNVVGIQAPTLVSALTGVAGQAALVYNAGTNTTRLDFDINGDAISDAAIIFHGNIPMTGGWFNKTQSVDYTLDSDTVEGNGSNNTLNGGAGFDMLFGAGGNDTLNGGTGRDTLFGGDGNDWLDGGAHNDGLFGGNGIDTFVFGVASGFDRVSDFVDGADKVYLNGVTLVSKTQIGLDTELLLSSGDVITLANVSASAITDLGGGYWG